MITWTVDVKPRAISKKLVLSKVIRKKLYALLRDLENKGYAQPGWPHFSALNKNVMTFHCHLNKGHPTYVVCWQVVHKANKKIEVYYVGTHESAPY